MNNKKKLQIFFPLILSLVLIAGMYFGFQLRDTYRTRDLLPISGSGNNTLQQIIHLIDARYVDSEDNKKLKTEAINGILHHLDPHTLYIPPSDVQSVNDDLEGGFEGIGVEFLIYHDTVNITHVLEGGPSEKAGLQTGDKIIAVNDSNITQQKMTPEKLQHLLKGEKNTPVKISVLRDNSVKPFTVKRGLIPLYSLDASYMVAPATGYIKLNKFSATTYNEFMKAMQDLQKQGMKRLIIDVRENPGGYMDAAVKIADELLDDEKLIVYTKGKNFPRTDYKCEKPGVFEKGPLVILVNEGSASASEILSGTIQDWDRGVIIGRRTFGKGLVQEQYPLQDGGALRLTVARYYMPSGRCIQKSYSNGLAAYNEDIMNRYHHGELVSSDSLTIADTTKYKTLIKKRTVYGGDGITPDIFIPLDTSKYDNLLSELFADNTLNDFAYLYFMQHQHEIKKYKSAEEFNKQFKVPEEMMKGFLQFAEADSVSLQYMTASDEANIKEQLKALLARLQWRNNGFYIVDNTDDAGIKKAVEILSTEK